MANQYKQSFEYNTNVSTFPEQLFYTLQSGSYPDDIISWVPDGKAFVIISPNRFTLEILPKFFQRCEFASFTRRLYWWGFKKQNSNKLRKGCDSVIFHHKFFQRDNLELCRKIEGKKTAKALMKSSMKSISTTKVVLSPPIRPSSSAPQESANVPVPVPAPAPLSIPQKQELGAVGNNIEAILLMRKLRDIREELRLYSSHIMRNQLQNFDLVQHQALSSAIAQRETSTANFASELLRRKMNHDLIASYLIELKYPRMARK